jgi:hypothetical protein
MPVLPDPTSFGQRPSLQPSATVAGYNPTTGRDVAQAGKEMQGAADVLAETNLRQDAMAAKDGANRLTQAAMLIQYNDKDGWANTREQQAVGKPFIDTYAGKFNDERQKIRDSLQSDAQRALFDKHADVEALQMQSSLLRHQAAETQKANDSTDNARVTLSLQKIARDPNNIVGFGTEMSKIEGAVTSNGERNGLSQQQIDVNLGKVRTAAYVSRIQALMHGIPGVVEPDADAAAALFKSVEPILGEQAIRDLSPQLAVAGTQQKAQKIGAGLAAKYDYTQTGDAQKEIDASDMPAALKTAVRAEVEHRHAVQQSDADKAQALGVSKVMEQVYGGASKGQVLASPEFAALRDKGAVLKAIDDKAYTDVLRANANDARAISKLQRAETELHIKGAAAAFNYLDPQTLVDTPRAKIEALLPTLGRDWTAQILQRKDSLEKKGVADAKVDHDDMMAILGEMGLKPFEKAKSDEGKAAIATTQSRVERMLTAVQQATGKPLSREQKNQIMREEVAKTVTVDNTFWFNDTKPIAELSPDELSRVIVPPQEASRSYSEMADLYKRSAGKLTQYEPTPENMRRYYLTHRKGSMTAPMIPAASR